MPIPTQPVLYGYAPTELGPGVVQDGRLTIQTEPTITEPS